MDVISGIEHLLVERKKRNKRRKAKKDENPRITIRTKSGLTVLGDALSITKEKVEIAEFVFEQIPQKWGPPLSNNHYTGRTVVIDRREVEVVFIGKEITAP